jgi:hypothetical protein
MTMPDVVEKRTSVFVLPKSTEIVSMPIRPRIKIVSYTSEPTVFVREGSMEMIDPTERIEMIENTSSQRWWEDIKPRHFAMAAIGVSLILIGLYDFMLSILSKVSLLFWPNDLLVIFGGVIVIQIALRFAITRLRQ